MFFRSKSGPFRRVPFQISKTLSRAKNCYGTLFFENLIFYRLFEKLVFCRPLPSSLCCRHSPSTPCLRHRTVLETRAKSEFVNTYYTASSIPPLRPLYGICTLYVRYLYAFEAYKYRTYSVHIPYNGQRNSLSSRAVRTLRAPLSERLKKLLITC